LVTANGTTQVLDRKRLQDRVPIDAITADARKARPGRTLLGLIGGLLFLAGFITARAFGVLWLSGAWCFSAVKVGWRQARGEDLAAPSLEAVMAENARLRAELARVS
jgi:hypothetical protein